MSRTIPQFDQASPDDTDSYSGDFRHLLAAGETITGTPTVTIDGPDDVLTVVSGSIATDGSIVRVKLANGTPESSYFVVFSIETSEGRELSRSVPLEIAAENRPLR